MEKATLPALYIKRIIKVGLIYLMHTFFYWFFSKYHINANYKLLTDLDKLFPFVPEMIYLYISYYFIVVLSVFFIKTEEEFNRIMISILGTLFLTYPFFYFIPAYYRFPVFETHTFTTKLLQWCYNADIPNNTFPSLHVGLSFTMAYGINHYNKKIGKLYIGWAILIALSTIMVRKHFLIDTLGGIIIANFSYYFFVNKNLIKYCKNIKV